MHPAMTVARRQAPPARGQAVLVDCRICLCRICMDPQLVSRRGLPRQSGTWPLTHRRHVQAAVQHGREGLIASDVVEALSAVRR